MSDHCGSVEYFVMVIVVAVVVLRRVQRVFVVKERGRCCVREVRWWGMRWGTDFCTEGIKENNTKGPNNANDATSLV
jgi:hypothetical protein